MAKKTILLATSLALASSMSVFPSGAWASQAKTCEALCLDTGGVQAKSASGKAISAFEEQRALVMLHKLWDRFGLGGKDAAIDNNSVEASYALNLLPMGSVFPVDSSLVLKKLEKSRTNPSFSAGTLAKYCLILSRSDLDRSELRSLDRELLSMTDEELNKGDVISSKFSIWGAVWIQEALATCSQMALRDEIDNPEDPFLSDEEAALLENLRVQVEDYILDHQGADGRFGDEKLGYDNQTTAQALFSMLESISVASMTEDGDSSSMLKRKQAATRAYEALMASQLSDGSWAYMPLGAKGDIDTTGCALKAIQRYKTEMGDRSSESDQLAFKGISYLLSIANANLDGIDKKAAPPNETMAASSAFAGLASVLCTASDADLSIGSPLLKLPKPSSVKGASKKAKTVTVTWKPNKNDLLAADGYKVTIKSGSKTVVAKTVKNSQAKKVTLALPAKTAKVYKGKKLKAQVSSFRLKSLAFKSSASKICVSNSFKLHK